MPDNAMPPRTPSADSRSPFDDLVGATAPASGGTFSGGSPAAGGFTTAFRGYDKDEVDAALSGLQARLRAESEQVAQLKERQRRAGAANAQGREALARLEAELAAAQRESGERQGEIARLEKKLSTSGAQGVDTITRLEGELAAARDEIAAAQAAAQSDVAAAEARAQEAEKRFQTLSEQMVENTAADAGGRHQFEEVLRVAEEQASVLIRNATVQGERVLIAAREEVQNRRKDAQIEAEGIISQAQHEAQQVRLKIDTELTAHQARLEREAAHSAEKISQAEQEAAAIRSEAEKGAAALRSMVARETSHSRAEAEEAVRELRVRALEFEASLTRRQDDAQQEFLVLHNQAVAHAERITQDANEQVASSLEHAQRVSAKAEDFEKVMRAQAVQIEADASMRARETLDRARDKAQKIIDMVTGHAQAVLRDAEDRTRQLRWQQHQMLSFMSEVKELIRPEAPLGDEAEVVSETLGETGYAVGDEQADVVAEARAELDAESADAALADHGDAADEVDAEADDAEADEVVSDAEEDGAENAPEDVVIDGVPVAADDQPGETDAVDVELAELLESEEDAAR